MIPVLTSSPTNTTVLKAVIPTTQIIIPTVATANQTTITNAGNALNGTAIVNQNASLSPVAVINSTTNTLAPKPLIPPTTLTSNPINSTVATQNLTSQIPILTQPVTSPTV